MRKLLCALALSAVASLGADVSGKWSGSFEITREGETHSDTAYLVLKQEGSNITGTAGPNEDRQYPIKRGKIEDDLITLEVEHEPGAQPIIVQLKLDGDDHATGEAKGQTDEGAFRAKLDIKRQK
jgi:hypothetical protein